MHSIYIRSCLYQSGDERPNEIELRIMSTDIANSTSENRTKVIVSTCESSPFCRESRTTTVDIPDIAPSPRRECSCPLRPLTTIRRAPFRRRVSFNDTTVFIGTAVDHRYHRTIMQDDDPTSPCHDDGKKPESNSRERENFDYDIWQTDDSSAGRSDDGYSENTPRIDNYAENSCTFDNDKSQRSENFDEQTIESGGCRRGKWNGENDVCLAVCVTEDKKEEIRKIDEANTVSNEDLLNVHKDVDSIVDDEHRMRGGCSGCCCAARDK